MTARAGIAPGWIVGARVDAVLMGGFERYPGEIPLIYAAEAESMERRLGSASDYSPPREVRSNNENAAAGMLPCMFHVVDVERQLQVLLKL